MSKGHKTIECDVAVVGAGPGGSVAAILLARRGVRVLIIDRSTFPREKLCGDFISYDAAPVLEYAGVWNQLKAAGGVEIDRARIVAGKTTRLFPLPERSMALSRHELDTLLLDAASAAGAVSMTPWNVESSTFNGATHLLDLRQGTTRSPICAKVVIGAWGRWGRLDVTLGRAFVAAGKRYFGLAQYGVARREEWKNSVDLYGFPGGYVGVVDVEENRVNLCGLVDVAFLNRLRGKVDGWLPNAGKNAVLLAEEIERAAPLERHVLVSPPVIFSPARDVVVDHILTVGDAAVVMPPVVGGGIAAAMQTAVLAADASLRLLMRPEERTTIEREYTTQVTLLLRRRRRWARSLGALLSRPTVCEAILRMARHQAIWDALVQQTRSDLHTVERIVEEWRRSSAL